MAYDHPHDTPGPLPGAVGDPPRRQRSQRASDYRGYAGQLASGALRTGRGGGGAARRASARGSPRSTPTTGELEEAVAPMSLTLRLEDELDVSRGELICHPEQAPDGGARAAGRRVLDDRPAAAPRRALPAEAHLAHATAVVEELYDLRRRPHARAHRRPAGAGRSTTSAGCACARAFRSRSTPTAATAARAASS